MQSNAQRVQLPRIGVATSMGNDSLLKAAGFDYIEEGARKLFGPAVPDTAWQRTMARMEKMQLKIPSCNLFLPGTVRLIGPTANEQVILGYVDTLMQRARDAGVRIIVFGSAGSRQLENGQDPAEARLQLIAISRKMAAVAAKYDRIIAIENLNRTEDNFINTLAKVVDIVKAVDHPNFRITADIYHMKKEDEAPSVIAAAAPYLVHCHIAEKEGRRAPGSQPDDFVPYLAELKKAGYQGNITIECRWENMKEECRAALAFLRNQLQLAYR
ncbi:sugar phosphate isomerase/epimerase family protein [Chitinophaga alhagiae]|uniref:sugar phosphate isomerase/epimerase family protein n=1 Tax=Chitinophaga alhagiae TaxID=2203219 RepID=UPI0018E4E3F8|nr:sugar phosphate isomerase/epimerase family protein [Chitinophaga alhagiae]